jgi:hypothetical protein
MNLQKLPILNFFISFSALIFQLTVLYPSNREMNEQIKQISNRT